MTIMQLIAIKYFKQLTALVFIILLFSHLADAFIQSDLQIRKSNYNYKLKLSLSIYIHTHLRKLRN